MRPPVVILCGGRGTRLREKTASMPKALVEIGGLPILFHVIGIYLGQGFDRFLLATGYRGKAIERAVAAARWPAAASIECVDTGLDTPTGGRLHRLAERLGDRTFCLTYADGVADIDLGALLAFHAGHGAEATVTVVRPELPWGLARLGGEDRVEGFDEKPRSEHWVNGGFFCLEPAVLGRLTDASVLEREPLEGLAGAGELRGYRHRGFWECMDTYKDAVSLNDLWAAGRAPWTSLLPDGLAAGPGAEECAPPASSIPAAGLPTVTR